MTRRQFLALLLINTLIALVVAVVVIWASTQLGVLATPAQATPYVIVPPTATPRPSPSATVPATPSPTMVTEVYVVQAGDTLFGIADRYEIEPQLLLALNDLDNANRLLVGQRLRVPAGVVPTATATLTAASTPEALVTSAPPAEETLLSAAVTTTTAALPAILAVITPGDLDTEAVVLANQGQAPLSLLNWSLSRSDGRRYRFPDMDLAPGAVLRVHTGRGIDDRENVFWSQTESAWATGETVLLYDQAGRVVASLVIGE